MTATYPFDSIIIIYNPNSTGESVDNAKQLISELQKELPKTIKVRLLPTERAGHAEELALETAKLHKRPLIISASGDGGYNEVVNGVLASDNPRAVVAVLASGNANDHDAAFGERTLLDRILKPNVQQIDAIKLAGTHDGKTWMRFAHSYVGFGLTAYVGKKLTEADLNTFNEKWLVLKYMVLFRGVRLRMDSKGNWKRYSSIVFSNIDRMSKVIKLAPESEIEDGRVEMYVLHSTAFARMALSLLFASTVGFRPTSQIKQQTMFSKVPIEVQLDGEVTRLDAKKPITISVAKASIRTLG